jgi:stearoyl-CoA desaturase (delta-9 desaturase)
MRLWLWLTTGMITKEWVAVHRKHHRFVEQNGDPHSPHVFGLLKVLLKGAWLYNDATKDKSMVEQYGSGTPDDWLEKNIYSKYSGYGILLLLIFNTLVFNGWGIIIWLVQMIWIPLWAAGVVNGIGHWWGYRNGDTKDNSKNILPIGLIIGGEEFHNNHHLDPGNPKLSRRWFEFDIGWMWLKLFSYLNLLKINDRKRTMAS